MPTGETLAVATPPPVPPPPTPTATASTQRRHRTISSSSSSLCTVSSAASSPSPSPSPSPRSRSTTTTSVPFSWEHHPGIPKTRHPKGAGTPSSAPTPLPLPPPLRAPTTSRPRHHHHSRRRHACGKPPPADNAADPFTAALAECTRERGGAGSNTGLMDDALFPARAPPASSSAPTSRRWSIASAGGVAGLLDLYGCKSAMSGVAEGAFVVRRSVAVVRNVPAGQAGRAGCR